MKIFNFIVLIVAGLLTGKPARHFFNKENQQYPFKSLSKYKGDTAAYVLDNFVTHQQNYHGKPLSALIKILEISPQGYVPIAGGNKEGESVKDYVGIYLRFFSSEVVNIVDCFDCFIPHIRLLL